MTRVTGHKVNRSFLWHDPPKHIAVPGLVEMKGQAQGRRPRAAAGALASLAASKCSKNKSGRKRR